MRDLFSDEEQPVDVAEWKKQLAQEIIVWIFFFFGDGKLCAKAIATKDYTTRSLNYVIVTWLGDI